MPPDLFEGKLGAQGTEYVVTEQNSQKTIKKQKSLAKTMKEKIKNYDETASQKGRGVDILTSKIHQP